MIYVHTSVFLAYLPCEEQQHRVRIDSTIGRLVVHYQRIQIQPETSDFVIAENSRSRLSRSTDRINQNIRANARL